MTKKYAPILLQDNEQTVFAVKGRILPDLASAIWISIMSLNPYALLPLLIFHRSGRAISYIITTQRVLAVEPQGIIGSIPLMEITRMRTTKSAMMLYGSKERLWLSRLPDAIFFENIINNLRKKMGQP